MNSLFIDLLRISALCSFLIIFIVFLDKIIKEKYSRRWIYVTWFVIGIRLLIPIDISLVRIPVSDQVVSNYINLDKQKTVDAVDTKDLFSEDSGLISNSKHNVSYQDESTQQFNATIDGTKNVKEVRNEIKEVSGKSYKSPTYQLVHRMSIIWLVGAVFFLLYHLFSYYLYHKEIKRWSMPVKDSELMELYQTLCKNLGIKHKIKLFVSKKVTYPILVGIRKSSIVLPDMNFSKEQFEFIIKHELIHYKNGDLYYKMLMLLANALHWFNPLVHVMVYLANNDMEIYCDERLLLKKDLEYREKYSMVLLEVMINATKTKSSILATGFCGKKKQIKKRFNKIMNGRSFGKGTTFFVSFVFLIILSVNLVACTTSTVRSKAENPNNVSVESGGEFQKSNKETEVLNTTSNILVLGTDNHRYDSILMITINPAKKNITFTSFLRDMYLELPNQNRYKLSHLNEYGGAKIAKETLETNFNIKIDNTVVIDMNTFQSIIDMIGGVEIAISEREADYLNQTNYISDKKNRNVKPGTQILNGNQALGYVRVRYVPTMNGEVGDIGRTTRLKNILLSALKEMQDASLVDLIKIAPDIIKSVDTDIDINSALLYLNAGIEKDFGVETLNVPYEGSYITDKEEVSGMMVLLPDIEKNKRALYEMLQ